MGRLVTHAERAGFDGEARSTGPVSALKVRRGQTAHVYATALPPSEATGRRWAVGWVVHSPLFVRLFWRRQAGIKP